MIRSTEKEKKPLDTKNFRGDGLDDFELNDSSQQNQLCGHSVIELGVINEKINEMELYWLFMLTLTISMVLSMQSIDMPLNFCPRCK